MNDIKGADKKFSIKIIAVIVAVVIITASIGALFLAGPLTSFLGMGKPEPVEYSGMIVPNSTITGDYFSDGYQFTGRPTDAPTAPLETFEIDTSVSFDGVTGGSFMILEEDGTHSLDDIVSSDTSIVTNDQVPGMMDQTYSNIEVTMISVSIVYNDYTFGIGTTGYDDYIWIAPHGAYPTLFNEVEAQGMILDQASLDQMAEDFHTSFFASVDLQKVSDIAFEFGFSFSGVQDNFLLINEISYVDTIDIEGDVIDTVTPDDLDRLSDIFTIPGTEWIMDVVGNIGEGCAFLSESYSTIYDNKFWILLYPLELGNDFDGICQLEVSKSSFPILSTKTHHSQSSFVPDTASVSFDVNVGIIIAVQEEGYSSESVLSLWRMMGDNAPTQVESVSLRGYGVVIDLETLSSCLDQAIGVPDSQGGLSVVSTFKNPAFVFILDENFTTLMDDDIPIWHYAAVCIIPNYVHDESAFRYLRIDGTAYDMSHFFLSDNPVFHIPLIIADRCVEVEDGLQQVSIKDMRSDDLDYRNVGGVNGAYVAFDAKPIGTSLISLCNIFGGLSSIASQYLPVDLGVYLAFQRDGEHLQYVPVIYLSSGKGSTYFGTENFDIRGMYLDFSYYSETVNDLTDEAADKDNTSILLPTGFVLAFTLDKISLELEQAEAEGPDRTTSEEFVVEYSFDPAIQDDEGLIVELYWTNAEGWFGTTWNYYGMDPTPGDGRFTVNYDELDGDGYYGWFIRVKNGEHLADDHSPGFWDNAECHTGVNVMPPQSVLQYYPLAPAPGTSLTLRWEMSDDPFFDHYEIFYGLYSDFTPSESNRLNLITNQYTTERNIINTVPGTQYYFIVRVVDVDGFYTDSNMNFTRTFSPGDSGDTMSTATVVLPETAWTEETTFFLDPEDLFKIYLHAGDILTVDMRGNTLGGGDLYAYDTDGHYLTSSETIGVTEQVQITASMSGYYYIMVYSSSVGTDWYTLWFHVG